MGLFSFRKPNPAEFLYISGSWNSRPPVQYSSELANAKYVDDSISTAIAGMQWKIPVAAATTEEDGNIPLSTDTSFLADNYTITIGMRVFLGFQTLEKENGIYLLTSSGLERTSDANTWVLLQGAIFNVLNGNLYDLSDIRITVPTTGTIDVDPITWNNLGVGTYTFDSTYFSVVSNNVSLKNNGIGFDKINKSSLTASTILSADASKNIVSLATDIYPNLTELSFVKGLTSAIQVQIDSKQSALGYTPENAANKGLVNGYAGLDSNGYVPLLQTNPALLGAVNYQGSWDASTNTPELESGVGTKGFYYVVSVSGSTNIDGITNWVNKDWIVFNGAVWQQVNNSSLVSSVNGQTGVVLLTTDTIPEATSLYFTNARAQSAISSLIGSTIQAYSANLVAFSAKTVPTGDVVGTSDTQTLTNKGGLISQWTNDAGYITGAAGVAGGDLSGSYPNPTVSKINGVSLGSTTATSGNLMIASGSAWVSRTMGGNATMDLNGNLTIGALQVTNAMLAGSIADAKLNTISTSGKVANSATTATPLSTANSIVSRNALGGFEAGAIYSTAEIASVGTGGFLLYYNGQSNGSSGLLMYKRGNTVSLTGSVVSGSEMGYIAFSGWNGIGYQRGAYIIANPAENFSSTAGGTQLNFFTTTIGTNNQALRMTMDNRGIATGTTTPKAQFHAYNAASGLSSPIAATQIYIESSSESAMTFASSNSGLNTIYFQRANSTSSTNLGYIQYNHSSGFLTTFVEGTRMFTISKNSFTGNPNIVVGNPAGGLSFNQDAIMQFESATQALLMPRSTSDMANTPVAGMLYYNSSTANLRIRNASAFTNILTGTANYDSGNQTITQTSGGTAQVFSHGLGGRPIFYFIFAVCLVNDTNSGFVVGDVINLSHNSVGDGNKNYVIWANNTQIGINGNGSGFASYGIINKNTGAISIPNAANFAFRVLAWI